jgi:hypothetical protein
MPEPLVNQARDYLGTTKGQWPEVSRRSGVPYSTITKLFQGVIPDPRISTVQRLLDDRDRRPSLVAPLNSPNSDSDGRTIQENPAFVHSPPKLLGVGDAKTGDRPTGCDA